jgi:hypothetical protein
MPTNLVYAGGCEALQAYSLMKALANLLAVIVSGYPDYDLPFCASVA